MLWCSDSNKASVEETFPSLILGLIIWLLTSKLCQEIKIVKKLGPINFGLVLNPQSHFYCDILDKLKLHRLPQFKKNNMPAGTETISIDFSLQVHCER